MYSSSFVLISFFVLAISVVLSQEVTADATIPSSVHAAHVDNWHPEVLVHDKHVVAYFHDPNNEFCVAFEPEFESAAHVLSGNVDSMYFSVFILIIIYILFYRLC
jgi:hypothetical protein